MLIVAPSGNTNSVDLLETPAFLWAHSIVTGRVAEELAVEKAVKMACNMWRMNKNGLRLVNSQ